MSRKTVSPGVVLCYNYISLFFYESMVL